MSKIKMFEPLEVIKHSWDCCSVIEDNPRGGHIAKLEAWVEDGEEDINERASGYAHLFSAAPDLLEACRALLENHQQTEPHHEDMCSMCIAAKAAIKKAEGGL